MYEYIYIQSMLPYVVSHLTWFLSKCLILQQSCHESEQSAPRQSIIFVRLFSTHKLWNDYFEVRNIKKFLFCQINTVGKISKVNSRSIFPVNGSLIDWLIGIQLQEQKRNGSPLHKSPAWPSSPPKLVEFYARWKFRSSVDWNCFAFSKEKKQRKTIASADYQQHSWS